MTISDQASNNVDAGIERIARTRVFNLRNVLELIHDTLNHWHQSVLHVHFYAGDELHVESFQQLLE